MPPAPVAIDSRQHQQQLGQLTEWQISGKFGFKSPEQKQSASLSWHQNNDDYLLSLSTILGTSILSMQGKPDWVTLYADDHLYEGPSASELIWQITGWSLPVEQLPVWIKGQSITGDQVQLTEQGWIAQLTPACASCQGWLIRYDDYQALAKFWLPHKIQLLNQDKHIQVTIKVNSWTLK